MFANSIPFWIEDLSSGSIFAYLRRRRRFPQGNNLHGGGARGGRKTGGKKRRTEGENSRLCEQEAAAARGAAHQPFSYSVMGPTGYTSAAPFFPSLTLLLKKGSDGSTFDATKAHSTTSCSPASPRRTLSLKRAAAYAIERVAEPAPAFASTTSVPASWMRFVSLSSSSFLVS